MSSGLGVNVCVGCYWGMPLSEQHFCSTNREWVECGYDVIRQVSEVSYCKFIVTISEHGLGANSRRNQRVLSYFDLMEKMLDDEGLRQLISHERRSLGFLYLLAHSGGRPISER